MAGFYNAVFIGKFEEVKAYLENNFRDVLGTAR